MIFAEPSRTPIDLSWRMLGTDIRVHPMFWLISVFLNWHLMERADGGPKLLALWVACIFVSILIHEFGHVFMGRLFGAYGHIVLHGFGGLAIGASSLDRRWQRILVYFAGPLTGFVFLAAVLVPYFLLALPREADVPPRGIDLGVDFLFQINLFWGLVNLLPVWPLDVGQISRDLLDGLMPRSGNQVAMVISIVVAIAAAVASYYVLGSIFLPLFFAFLALTSFQTMQAFAAARTPYREPDPWEQERDPWER